MRKFFLLSLALLASFSLWADATHSDPATVTYGGKTFLDAANTPGNAGTENVYLNYGVNGMYNNLSTFTWLTYDKFDKSNNSYTLPSGAVGFCTPGSSSSSEFYGNVNFNTNNKTSWMKVYVTGTEEIGFIWENNNTTNNRFIVYSLSEIDSEGEPTGTPQTTTGTSPLATGKQYDKFTGLSHSKYYCLTISTEGASSSKFYGITFKRYVAPLGYSITYHCNGATSGCPSDVASGATALPSTLATPAKTGYDFDKWYTDEGLTTPATAGATLSANADLYAAWKQNDYTVTYALGDGTGTLPTETSKHYGDKFYLHDGTTGITAPNNQEFKGWNDGTSTYNGGAQYTMPANNVTLTAQWGAITVKHDISYTNLKGCSVTGYPTQYSEGEGIASFDPLGDIDGWHFTGWSPASISTTATTDQIIEAQWVQTYSVTYNLNGAASGTLPTETAKYAGQEFALAAQGDIVAPDGKAFLCWKDQDGNKVNAEATYTMPGKPVTLYAHWATVSETVLYSWEGGTPSPTEIGGTVVTKNTDDSDVETEQNVNADAVGTNATYKSIRVQSAIKSNAWYNDYILLTTTKAVKTGDKVRITACTTKGDTSKKGSVRMLAGTTVSSTALFTDAGGTYNDIKVAENVPEPNTRTFTVGSGINTTTMVITRHETSTNCWITKLEIVREEYVDEDELYAVTFAAPENGTLVVKHGVNAITSGDKFANGTVLNVAATPSNGYALTALTAGGEDILASKRFTVGTSAVAVAAAFSPTYAVTYNKGTGSIKEGEALPTQAATVEGGKFNLASGDALEKIGYNFDGWLCNIDEVKYAAGAEYTMTAAATTFTAQWTAIDYTITCADAENGSVSAKATANYGEVVTLTVTPADGYEIASVKYNDGEDHVIEAENDVYSFTMPAAAVTVSATFSLATALDNTDVNAKAVKRLENGILVIEKNGRLFNAQGQLVK